MPESQLMRDGILEFERLAKEHVLCNPGRSLAQSTILLGQDDPAFWRCLVQEFTSASGFGAKELIRVDPQAYLHALTHLSKKDASVMQRFNVALEASGAAINPPMMTLGQLHREGSGPTSKLQWHRFISAFDRVLGLTSAEMQSRIYIAEPGRSQDYIDSLHWVDGLKSGVAPIITDEALYVALANAVATAITEMNYSPTWAKYLNRIPSEMRSHSSLGLLYCLEGGKSWCDEHAAANTSTLNAPLGAEDNGLAGMYWSRAYESYTTVLADYIKEAYLEKASPKEIILKVKALGTMRISPPSFVDLAEIVNQNSADFFSIEMTAANLNDFIRLGVSSAVVARHPSATPELKRSLVSKEMGM